MRSLPTVISILIVASVVSVCCKSFVVDESPDKKLSAQALQAEFKLMTDRLEKEVPDMYYLCPKAIYDSTKQSILHSLTDSMSVVAFYRHIMPLFVVLKDPHFQCFIDKTLLSKLDGDLPGLCFPFTVMISNNRVYTDKNLSAEKGIPRGTEILAINGVPTAEILHKIKAGVAYAPNEEHFFEQWHESIFYRDLLLLLDFRNNFKVQLPNSTILVKGVSKEELNKAEPVVADFEYKLLRSGEHPIGYLRIGTLLISKKDSLQAILEKFFGAAAREQVKDIIIDIRSNLGGSTQLGRMVFDHITDQEYRLGLSEQYLEKGVKTTVDDSAQPLTRPIKRDFFGRAVLLTDVKTFSSAHMMANAFQFYKLGKVVGQVSVEPLFITGEIQLQVLPKSRCNIYFPTSNFTLPGFDSTKVTYLMPDLEVYPGIEDRLHDKDLALEAAMKLLSQPH